VITLHCCGESYLADEQHVGRKIKCRKCGRVLTIEAVVPTHAAASAAPARANRPSWPTTAPRNTRPVAIAKVALGGIGLIAVLVWIYIAGSTGDKTKSAVKSVEGPAALAPTIESRSAPPERSSISLPNGTWVLRPRGISGHGVLRIQKWGRPGLRG
jgi:hypothetical protein